MSGASMILLKEIHSLASKQHKGTYSFTYTVRDLEPDGFYAPDFDVNVTFNFNPESYSQHIPGDPTTREHHPSNVELTAITLEHDVNLYDIEGQNILKTYSEGTSAEWLPGWDKSIERQIENAAFDHVPSTDDYKDSQW